MRYIYLLLFISISFSAFSQEVIRGVVRDAAYNDPIIGANVIIEGSIEGTISDWDGSFELSTGAEFPIVLIITYIGYADQRIELSSNERVTVVMKENANLLEEIVVKGSRISDKQKESPLTIEALDIIAIKETPAANFYDGLGALKGVDLTAASLGFKVINTRGFNSTSPVRSLQIIDGVDNQAPGLNFSLGNFLGSSELDVNKVEIIVGASSAFYGPNAFNGVISMETKDPFFYDGLSAMIKLGERNLVNAAVRWANKLSNKDGKDVFAYKLNFEALRADDWVADNYDPVDGSAVSADNPGRYDAVNIYGDEYQSGNDFSSFPISQSQQGTFYRSGYREIDLVDYDTRNYKASANFHFRTKPDMEEQSPELIVANSFGSGTTVYQGDNRFSLKGITFLQNRIEYRKRNKFFIRAYSTRTGAGDSYDPYFTALELQDAAKDEREWS
ncbi:MAG: carboxypeptidase-like regulatory domain-containing protein, partial [Saprospiraceae bacterium]